MSKEQSLLGSQLQWNVAGDIAQTCFRHAWPEVLGSFESDEDLVIGVEEVQEAWSIARESNPAHSMAMKHIPVTVNASGDLEFSTSGLRWNVLVDVFGCWAIRLMRPDGLGGSTVIAIITGFRGDWDILRDQGKTLEKVEDNKAHLVCADKDRALAVEIIRPELMRERHYAELDNVLQLYTCENKSTAEMFGYKPEEIVVTIRTTRGAWNDLRITRDDLDEARSYPILPRVSVEVNVA